MPYEWIENQVILFFFILLYVLVFLIQIHLDLLLKKAILETFRE